MPPTPTDYPHTPEPWTAEYCNIFAADDRNPRARVATTEYSAFTWKQEEANAARAVACVNACAGMADPAAALASVRAALAANVLLIDAIGAGLPVRDVLTRAETAQALTADAAIALAGTNP